MCAHENSRCIIHSVQEIIYSTRPHKVGKKRDMSPSHTLYSVSLKRRTVWSCAAFCFDSEQKVRSLAFDKCTVGSEMNRLLRQKKKAILHCSFNSTPSISIKHSGSLLLFQLRLQCYLHMSTTVWYRLGKDCGHG